MIVVVPPYRPLVQTMRSAYEKGFNVITLTDACATTSSEGQAVTGGSYGMFSTPMTVDDYSRLI